MTAEAPALVVHYAEIGLKGRNRPDFEAALRRGLERTLRARAAKVRVLRGRLIVFLADGTDARAAAKDASKVFGVSHVIPAHEAPREPEPLAAAIIERLRERPAAPSFAVRVKRADKKYPITSANLNAELGRRIIEAIPMPVCLDDPSLAIDVEILEREAWFGFERVPGVGGLPVGASGRVACLISGGIDSPVSSWLMMKRGCQAVFVHFHSAPYTDAASQHKVRDVVRILAALQGKSRLWLVPFLPVQEAIVKGAPPALRVVLYRRSMVRIAAAVAAKEGALA
ncbi:MAG: THUMP domain-containing protein, partial [Planctomycetota bacterium]